MLHCISMPKKMAYCFLITKAKKKIGSTGSDPYLQVALYYAQFIRDLAVKTPLSVLPCFHIFYFGKCSVRCHSFFFLNPLHAMITLLKKMFYAGPFLGFLGS